MKLNPKPTPYKTAWDSIKMVAEELSARGVRPRPDIDVRNGLLAIGRADLVDSWQYPLIRDALNAVYGEAFRWQREGGRIHG